MKSRLGAPGIDLLHTVPYTRLVQRSVAMLLAVMLVLAPGQLLALHVHVYADHDHPEHHHGPAVHEHRDLPRDSEDGRAYVEACDAGAHVVSCMLTCITASPPHLDADTSALVWELAAPVSSRFANDLDDVRVHGPPPRAPSSPRAPPLTSCL
jgi:hypothetical protein